jgi:hypothetical protein
MGCPILARRRLTPRSGSASAATRAAVCGRAATRPAFGTARCRRIRPRSASLAPPRALRPLRKHVADPAGRHLASWPAPICILTSHGSMLLRQTACAQSPTSQARQRPLTGTGSASRRSPGWLAGHATTRTTEVVYCRELRRVITTRRRDHGRVLRRRLAPCAGPGAAEDLHEPPLHRGP